MFVVMTRVKLRPDTAARCAALFERTNPDLVKDAPDWLGARMLFNRETHEVTVLASWRDIASYRRLRSTDAFQAVMGQFAELFAAPPEITTHEVLLDMVP